MNGSRRTKNNRRVKVCMLLLLLTSCSDSSSAVDGAFASEVGLADGSADTAPPWTPPFAPAVCGAASYKWLTPSSMGKVTFKTESSLYSMSAAALRTMIMLTDYKGVVPVKYDVTVYFYRYETQDRGKKVVATAALGYPTLSKGTNLSAPYVAWLHGTTGFSDKCAPTYKEYEAALGVALMATQGYIGVAPDYIGMNGIGDGATVPHGYLVVEQTALGCLDAVRAAERLIGEVAPEGLKPVRKLVPWGASQGGHAALSTVLYAPYYAPEFDVPGGLAVIVPADISGQTEAALKTFGSATLLLAATATAYSRWYGYEKKLSEVIQDSAPYHFPTLWPKLMDTTCEVDKSKYNLTQVSDLFTAAFINGVLNTGWKGLTPWSCLFSENSLTTTSVKPKGSTPVLFVVGEKDDLVDAPTQRSSFDALCKAGYKMEYLECKGAKHTQGAIWSLTEQFAWIKDRLDGKPLSKTCQRGSAVCCKGTDDGSCTP